MGNLSMRNRPPGETFTRAVAVKPNSFDVNARTFTGAVLATSRPIRVRGGVNESLDLASARLPKACRSCSIIGATFARQSGG